MLKKISSLFGAQDMTQGRPLQNLLRFSVPLLIGNFAQQMYATVDSIVVGRYVGDKALSAVGSSMPVINLLLVLLMAVATGVGIMVAQYFGARDTESLSKSIGNAMTLIVAASLIITAIGVPFSGALLEITNTPEETFEMARTYLVIIFSGILAPAMYNVTSGILRGLGNSTFPLFTLLISSVLNTVLDVWMVSSLGMGVAGAAVATIISQIPSAYLCLRKLKQMKDTVRIGRDTLVPDRKYVGQLLRLGIPGGITQAIFSISMVLVQSLTNSMGYRVVTSNTAVMRIDSFAVMPSFTFGMAVATFVGQNVGANRMDRVAEGTKDALKLSLVTATVLVSLLLVFGGSLIRVFTTTEEIIVLGTRQIRILAAGYFGLAISQVFGSIMRGAGDTMPSMWISLITTTCIRVPLAYTMASLTRSPANPKGAPESVYFSLLFSWLAGAAANYIWYRRGNWRTKSLVRHPRPVEIREA